MESKIMICYTCESLAGRRGVCRMLLLREEDQWRSDQSVKSNYICFSQNYSVSIAILLRQGSRVPKANKVLLAYSCEIPLSIKMTLQSSVQLYASHQ